MFEHEIATAARRADLLREAAEFRAVRQAQQARRPSSRSQEPGGPVRGLRSRLTRSARPAPRPA
ncbi:hypothetical protein OG756_27285 [Streptomyces sp. NBC_01310]|uniref:hypothetical protein n=1 Tax=Streptomyces sp. NBC_01310 TaxID=2903820 RepID=UPI0035B644F5|nr:hypothetical protein OG756_27285 [Streptomyces sp. NBC_01310]